jgi:hypothetical protein
MYPMPFYARSPDHFACKGPSVAANMEYQPLRHGLSDHRLTRDYFIVLLAAHVSIDL